MIRNAYKGSKVGYIQRVIEHISFFVYQSGNHLRPLNSLRELQIIEGNISSVERNELPESPDELQLIRLM